MKNKSIKNKIFASALALTLTIGAFQLPSYVANAAETATPQLKIKKVLNLPENGVSTPNETFTFEFEKHSFNNKDAEKSTLPEITDKKTAFTEAMKDDMDTAVTGKQIIKLTDDVLKDVTFTKVGQYTYRVKEKKGNTNYMAYSGASYLISIFTKTGEDGKVKVDSIQIKKEKDDKGTDAADGKTPYTPGKNDGKGEGNNFVFNNNYDPKAGNDKPTGKEITTDDKKGFVLKKEVAGTTPNAHEKFKFSITAIKPVGTHSEGNTFKYTVVSNGNAGNQETGTYGTAFNVELKHGDRVVFGDVLLGSTVKADETDDKGYTKSIGTGSKINGQKVELDKLKQGLAIGDHTDGNFVNFVNTQQTPTGILMNHLPFIALVLAAVAGILFFVKNKKEDENTQA